MTFRGITGLVVLLASIGFTRAVSPKIHLITTFPAAFCFASNVAGDRIEIENLTSASGDLHDYQLKPAEIRRLSQADVVVMNGLGLESWMRSALATSTKPNVKIVRLSDGLHAQLLPLSTEGPKTEFNPHIWLDPELARHGVSNILAALVDFDPANASYYSRNASAYLERLTLLEQQIAILLAPVTNATFITYHDAFPYFARRFHLALAGVVEQVPEVSPSPRYLVHLFRHLRQTGVKALFTEPGEENRLARQIASDARIKLATLDPLEIGNLSLTSYEQAMLENAHVLVRALK